MDAERHIILFDGVCNLCNSAVQYVIKRDKKNVFKFASLQSDTGKKLLYSVGLMEDHLKSFVYILDHKVYTKSDAALRVAGQLSYPSKLLYLFLVVPKFLRNFFYDLIAKNRYRWFGKRPECMVPTPALKQKFIDEMV